MWLIIGLGVLVVTWLASAPARLRWKRQRICAQPFPKAWRQILKTHMPFFRHMPADLQLQLKKHIQVFIAEKNFIGCQGQHIDDSVRVLIAAQACLLLLNRKTNYYPRVKTVLVYPVAFVKQELVTNELGLKMPQRRILLGESWSNGQIVLSWQDTQQGALQPFDGQNLVIHEFAHQHDQDSGSANGAPLLAPGQSYEDWAQVLSDAFDHLHFQLQTGEPTLFDAYGASEPAEFFAVASEVFFERPQAVKQQYPALYQQLSGYYCVDPVNWQ